MYEINTRNEWMEWKEYKKWIQLMLEIYEWTETNTRNVWIEWK